MALKILQQSVGITAVALIYPATKWLRLIITQATGNTTTFIGFDANVSSANGMALPANRGWVSLDLPPGQALYAISTQTGQVVTILVQDTPSPFDVSNK